MNRPIIFQPAARLDLLEACAWYEKQRTDLGNRFELAVERALDVIATSSDLFPIVHRDVRRALVRPFPYGVFYRVRGEAIHVIAVMHGSRDPARWRSRTNAD